MKVKSLDIKGIGGIKELSLKFNENLNVICGTNGIGKTTILNVIADAFAFSNTRIIKRNALFDKGKYDLSLLKETFEILLKSYEIPDFTPESHTNKVTGYDDSNNIINFNLKRDIPYYKLNAIPRDADRRDHEMGVMAVLGINAEDVKGWFDNRHLFSKEGLPDEFIKNFELSKKVFSLFDNSVKFHSVDFKSLDIMLETLNGKIYFEYMSSGYKTCFYIILGIIREIELRYVEKPIYVGDFDGIVLIDEIDMHLHPTWQVKLIQALKKIFPKIQFIVTTHSPSILQSLNKDEIIALGLDENGNTIVKDLELGEYGLQGWTLEEILQDVMGMPSTTSELYQSTIKEFDKAMDEENGVKIIEQYEILKKMLHPNNPLQKLLKLQVAEWEE